MSANARWMPPEGLTQSEPMYSVGGARVNRFDLYEMCVQACETQVRFLSAVHGGQPLTLADDFSGPAGIARAWVGLSSQHAAVAVDTDDVPLAHAKARLIADQGDAALTRFLFLHCDVLEAGGSLDVIAACNFALCELHTRQQLLTYLRHALFRLNAGGVLVADLYLGPTAFTPGEYEVAFDFAGDEVVYQWEQAAADPLTGRVRCAIHFDLPGGVHVENAFAYDWRLWSVPELRDAMREAGFAATEVYADYGEAIDLDGKHLVRPASTDARHHAGAPIDFEPGIDPAEDAVVYVVGRVTR